MIASRMRPFQAHHAPGSSDLEMFDSSLEWRFSSTFQCEMNHTKRTMTSLEKGRDIGVHPWGVFFFSKKERNNLHFVTRPMAPSKTEEKRNNNPSVRGQETAHTGTSCHKEFKVNKLIHSFGSRNPPKKVFRHFSSPENKWDHVSCCALQ